MVADFTICSLDSTRNLRVCFLLRLGVLINVSLQIEETHFSDFSFDIGEKGRVTFNASFDGKRY